MDDPGLHEVETGLPGLCSFWLPSRTDDLRFSDAALRELFLPLPGSGYANPAGRQAKWSRAGREGVAAAMHSVLIP